jgi:hypothetical protein
MLRNGEEREISAREVGDYLNNQDAPTFCNDRRVVATARLAGSDANSSVVVGISGAIPPESLMLALDVCPLSVSFCRDRECEWLMWPFPGSIAGRCRITRLFLIGPEICDCQLNAARGRTPPPPGAAGEPVE